VDMNVENQIVKSWYNTIIASAHIFA
jgi:hypothetical protein